MNRRRATIAVALAICSASCAGAPDLTAQDKAVISARALAELCNAKCSGLTIYVRNRVQSGVLLAGQEMDMLPEMMAAIDGLLEEARFVSDEEAHALVVDGAMVEVDAILLHVGPVIPLDRDVIGVEVGSHTAADGFHGSIQQFEWSGAAWEAVGPEKTGITTVTAVS